MLTEKDLRALDRIVHRFTDEIDFMSEKDLERLKRNVTSTLHATQVKNFYVHVQNSLQAILEPNGEELYSTSFTIHFNGKTIRLDDCPQSYDGILCMLKDYIEDYLEESLDESIN